MVSSIHDLNRLIYAIASGTQQHLSAGNLSDDIEINGCLQVKRDFIREAFFDLGIEVEFSGRDHNEKGVVVDIDEEKVLAMGLNPETLRFGQTIVKAIL